MGQRPKPPTKIEQARARKQYERDVAAGRRIPLPDLGQLRDPEGAWLPIAGQGFEIVEPRRPVAERTAKNVAFNPLDYVRKRNR